MFDVVIVIVFTVFYQTNKIWYWNPKYTNIGSFKQFNSLGIDTSKLLLLAIIYIDTRKMQLI